MNRTIRLACLLLAIAPGPVHAADMSQHFALQKTSLFEDGCFAPCECPVFIHDDLRGKFSLIPTENYCQVTWDETNFEFGWREKNGKEESVFLCRGATNQPQPGAQPDH